jgi:hypothetical protein
MLVKSVLGIRPLKPRLGLAGSIVSFVNCDSDPRIFRIDGEVSRTPGLPVRVPGGSVLGRPAICHTGGTRRKFGLVW